jgi:hypothetical protein
MIKITDQSNPSFMMFPYHTDRTAWRPFGLPMILVAPHLRDENSEYLPQSGILAFGDDPNKSTVRIYIADAGTSITPVAGHDHRGIFRPDIDLYSRQLTVQEVYDRRITIAPEMISADGQSFKITCRAGVIADLQYLPHADYYDLSDILLELESLPTGKYYLVYEASFYRRIVSDTGYLLCIDTSKEAFTRSRFLINHPGEIILKMAENTPAVYLTDTVRSQDTTLAFYRPFSDILQDIHDEQDFLERVNWVNEVQPGHIPYLGFLLGWDIPYFPQSLDALRRAVLRNTVQLQKFKGTKRAVRELFDLFGFAVRIDNIWWTPEGELVGPDEQVGPYKVQVEQASTLEPLLLDYQTPGYGQLKIPLINRPKDGSLRLHALLVYRDQPAYQGLQAIAEAMGQDVLAYPDDQAVHELLAQEGIEGHDLVYIDKFGKAGGNDQSGHGVLGQAGVSYDPLTNVLDLTFARHLDFDETSLYLFASYEYEKLVVPAEMEHLQSNRFDVEILSKIEGTDVRPDVILFLVEFLFRVKAFHSLLRKVLYSVSIHDVYQVTDWCVGGRNTQQYDTDAGRQQVPPEAIIPDTSGDACDLADPRKLGYRDQDLRYREKVITGLMAEFDGWKRVQPTCSHNHHGQDRVTEPAQQIVLHDGNNTYSDQDRTTLCDLDGRDYCYKGRVQDPLVWQASQVNSESWQFQMCSLGMGKGIYYLYPSLTQAAASRTADGLLGKWSENYRSLDAKPLHFTNDVRPDFRHARQHPAWRRPSLGITKDNLGFPGHRKPRMYALENDFQHPSWKWRPWDINFQCNCSPRYHNHLNYRLEEGSDGDQWLHFDDVPYQLEGNGLIPDVLSLGVHLPGTSEATEESVTHKIYLASAAGHPAITLSCSVDVASQTASTTAAPLFSSAAACAVDYNDFAEGYPASTGQYGYLRNSTTYFPSMISQNRDSLASQLGIPFSHSKSTVVLLFKLSSEVRVATTDPQYNYYKGYRLDCGCSRAECDSGGTGTEAPGSLLSCGAEQFLNQYGELEPDQVSIDARLTPVDRFGMGTIQMDRPNGTLFDLRQLGGQVDENGVAGPDAFPEQGSFSYQDEWGQIYEVEWKSIPANPDGYQLLDLVTVIKDPRVWGRSAQLGGMNRDKRIERVGIITTTRQIFRKINGGYSLMAQGSQQVVGPFVTTARCGKMFTNPFLHDVNNRVASSISVQVESGPAFTTPGVTGSSWGDPDSPAGSDLQWVDVFN